MSSDQRKVCPACAELIQAAARKCRYCGEWIHEDGVAESAAAASASEDVEEGHARLAGEDDDGFVRLRGRARLTNAGKMVIELVRALAPILIATIALLSIYIAARAGFEPAKTAWLVVRYGLAIGAATTAVYLLLNLLFGFASSFLASAAYLVALTALAFVAAPTAGVLYFGSLLSNAAWWLIAGGVVVLVCVSWIVGERVTPWGWQLERRLGDAWSALAVASKILCGRPLDMWFESTQCPACGVRSNEYGAPRFCGDCGVEFGGDVRPTRSPFLPAGGADKRCDNCRNDLPVDARFCGDCGHDINFEPDALAREQREGLVTIMLFLDFKWKWCWSRHRTLKKALAGYGENVRVVYRYVPDPNNKDSVVAAKAALCASEQGREGEMVEQLLAKHGYVPELKCEEIAEKIGLDMDVYGRCLSSERIEQRLASDLEDAISLDAPAPSCFFGYRRHVGGISDVDELRAEIDYALANPRTKWTGACVAVDEPNLDRDQVREGDIVLGTVIALTPEFVVVDIGHTVDGRVDISEFSDANGDLTVELGDEVQVLLESVEGGDGHLVLSKEKADRLFAWDEISAACERGERLIGTVSARVEGGWSVTLPAGVQAFLPLAQVEVAQAADAEALLGKTRRFSVIEFNKKDGKIVLSTRAVPEEDQAGREDIAPEPPPGHTDSAEVSAVPTEKECAHCSAPSPQAATFCGRCGHVLEADRAR